jgi:hypothetical protein
VCSSSQPFADKANTVSSATPLLGVTATLPEEGGELTITVTSEKEEDEEGNADSNVASSLNL